MRLDIRHPFVLLDDARKGGASPRLYRAPVEIVRADDLASVDDVLERIEGARDRGLSAAGYLSYAAAPAFEPRAGDAGADGVPIIWFGLFDRYEVIAPDDFPSLLGGPGGAWIGAPQPDIDRAEYERRAARIADLIAAGDIYQANLTFRATVRAHGHPLALYAAIRDRANAGYGAIVSTGDALILSFSPELFFALQDGVLTARPMKGTAPRGKTAQEDRALAEALHGDPKQRAENLMILDLMRNDFARIAEPGSVRVPERFVVEHYPTVHQMVSGVKAKLAPDRSPVDALRALFPCGSVTGAPKIRAMQVIGEVEQGRPRGVYTGAIGRIDSNGDAMFNVAIRTLTRDKDGSYTLGLGSGLVADSVPGDEWDECLSKGAFLTAGQRQFDLIETMKFDPNAGIVLLERHLERMKASAAAFDFHFDRHGARNELQAATFRLREPRKIRLLLSRTGAVAIEIAPMPAAIRQPLSVALAPLPVARDDFRLRHKTSDRGFYDGARAASGADEVVFVGEDGLVTEGSFTSVFVERDGVLVTPRADLGLLPGILRAELLATGKAVEGDVTEADLAQGFYVGNALRGLIVARLVA
ncbi:aminodeoxychorismate synthase component I [Stakelama marina]|uniref:Probable branched-chain-amino-acid aminotransferase n=1 Tax=Stakelama marina TaxID=2826939 RepID=A0A8T4IFY1_9SPHN|nr:aminodeoxychorismate synthase component I [Stakelama marina]MBR0552952.1 aminodeoxychorismate synthase component I [Stakelama marina]